MAEESPVAQYGRSIRRLEGELHKIWWKHRRTALCGNKTPPPPKHTNTNPEQPKERKKEEEEKHHNNNHPFLHSSPSPSTSPPPTPTPTSLPSAASNSQHEQTVNFVNSQLRRFWPIRPVVLGC